MTTFKEYLAHSWSADASEIKSIADNFKSNFNLMESEDDVMSMAALIVHVCGERLGSWEQGIDLLKKLKNNATINDKAQMNRLAAILNLGNNPNISIENFSASDQVRIYSATASSLAKLGGFKNAEKLLAKSTELESALSAEDPAIKELAAARAAIANLK